MGFRKNIHNSIDNILTSALRGDYPLFIGGNTESNLFGSGVSVDIGNNMVTSTDPKTRNIISMSPRASVLIKKKAFSSFKQANDIQWMDRTEKMLLRATKALFAYKVAQIRAYESLTKFEDFFTRTQEINLNLFAELLHNAQFLEVPEQDVVNTSIEGFNLLVNATATSLTDAAYDEVKDDVLRLVKRNAFGSEFNFTTWFVDPDNSDNYTTGPGTGVIEIGMFTNFACGASASFELEDPYRIAVINEDDIEVAISEALSGTLGLFDALASGEIEATEFDAKSVVAAGVEMLNDWTGAPSFDSTLDMDYVRRQLRKFYLGKNYINAGDEVYIFIRGNRTRLDYTDPSFVLQRDELKIDETILEAERNLLTNKKIDLETYKKIRKLSDNALSMQCVFGGYVEKTNRTFNEGRWSLNISCTDNMGWLTWSRFMIEPALQDPQGILEDPLTPYEIKRDASGTPLTGGGVELLDENKELLRTGLLTYDSGILNGQFANENNLLQGDYAGEGSLGGTKILQHPNGFIYRWKTGIITATLAPNTKDPLDENGSTLKTLQETYGLTVAEDVLTNLDVANVLSLLIVGQPYNSETFVEQAYQAHNISQQSSASSLSATDPLAAVLNVVRRQNTRFGNFRPYRMITLSNSTIEQTASSNILRQEINDNVKQLQQRRAELKSIAENLRISFGDSNDNGLLLTIKGEIASIDAGIESQLNVVRQSGSLSAADAITSNFNLFGQNRVLPLTGNFDADHEVTRAMMIVGAKRRIEDVRLNRDQNLFIVSDQYDQHTDIRPFLLALRDSSYNIFEGNFVNVFDKCKTAAGTANLEFFCNSQGHLEFRPPQWNKTPLTVLEKLFQINEASGKSIIPEFLRETFENRTSSIRREIHGLNVKIVMISMLLGKFPDGSIIPNLPNPRDSVFSSPGESASSSALRFFGVDPAGLKGDPENSFTLNSGNSDIFSIGNLVDTGNQLLGIGLNLRGSAGEEGDIINGDTVTLLGIFDPIFQEDVGLVNNVLSVARSNESFPAKEFATKDNLNRLRTDFRKLAGIDPAADLVGPTGTFSDGDFTFNARNGAISETEADSFGRVQNLFTKLQQTISERDSLVTILARNEEKEAELDEIESILSGEFTSAQENGGLDPDSVLGGVDFISDTVEVLEKTHRAITTITDIFSGDATKGSLFDHLVEDDTRNMLGPGSGRRFILKDEDIISCDFQERPPDFVRVDVVGNAPFTGSSLQKSFENKYFWAGGTDFDLWRQYGFKSVETRNLPYASNSETQCKPFAILELQLQRVKINEASVVVVGNEYYQPGDNVFIPSQGLLYYIRSVRHNFSWGGKFETTLVLENGHPPGEYLPSPLDIIGQQFLRDPLEGSTIIYRNQRGDDSYRVLQPDSTLVFPGSAVPPDDDETIAGTLVQAAGIGGAEAGNLNVVLDYRDNQVRYTNMMINLNGLSIGDRFVLIRGFAKGRSDPNINRVRKNMATMRALLENPVQISQGDKKGLGDDFLDFGSDIAQTFGANTGSTKGLDSMTLPNGQIVIPIEPDNIVEQIVYLDGDQTTSEIQCLNPELISAQTLDERNINNEDYEAVFPKGGPKQRTWLDIRDNLDDLASVVEVGILDVQRRIEVNRENINIDLNDLF
jgi:hypothetical protein